MWFLLGFVTGWLLILGLLFYRLEIPGILSMRSRGRESRLARRRLFVLLPFLGVFFLFLAFLGVFAFGLFFLGFVPRDGKNFGFETSCFGFGQRAILCLGWLVCCFL